MCVRPAPPGCGPEKFIKRDLPQRDGRQPRRRRPPQTRTFPGVRRLELRVLHQKAFAAPDNRFRVHAERVGVDDGRDANRGRFRARNRDG